MRTLIVLVMLFVVFSGSYNSIEGRELNRKTAAVDWDHFTYQYMAQQSPNIALDIEPMGGHRILASWIAGLLPDYKSGFRIITTLFAGLVVFGFYFFLRHYGATQNTALFVCTMLMCAKEFYGFVYWDYFQAKDMILMATILWSLWFMYRHNYMAWGITMAVGAINSELTGVLIPVLIVYLYETKTLKEYLPKYLVALIPYCVITVAVWLLPFNPTANFKRGVNPWFDFCEYLRLSPNYFIRFLRLAKSYAPICIIPVLFPKTIVLFFKHRIHLLVLVAAAFFLTMAIRGEGRYQLVAFVPAYWLLAYILQRRTLFNALPHIMYLLVPVAWLCTLHPVYGDSGISPHTHYLLTAVSTIIVTIFIGALTVQKDKIWDSNT